MPNVHACFYGERGSVTANVASGTLVLGLPEELNKFPYEIVPFQVIDFESTKTFVNYMDLENPPTTWDAPRSNHVSVSMYE